MPGRGAIIERRIAYRSRRIPIVNDPITRLRIVGVLEGASFLLLLGVAMPLKYMAGMPGMVRVVGMAHGLLWIAYVAAVIDVRLVRGWRPGRVARALLASVLPFGPFVFDASLRSEQAQRAEQTAVGVGVGAR
jgi:integral membrane protein